MNKPVISVLLLAFALIACAQDNTAPDNPTINEAPMSENVRESDEENNWMTERMDELPFNKFDFDIEYEDRFDFEVELERNPSGNIDVEYRDESKGIDEKGEKAFELLFSKLKEFEIDQNSANEDVIASVLQLFELNDDYTEFDLEIVFNDGTRREYLDGKNGD